MLSGREAELASRLREAAAGGDTSLVLTLLEDGAPFVVDSVRLRVGNISDIIRHTLSRKESL